MIGTIKVDMMEQKSRFLVQKHIFGKIARYLLAQKTLIFFLRLVLKTMDDVMVINISSGLP